MMDERTLVKNAKNGDRDSFAQLYMLYRDRLYRYALFRVGGQNAADAVSECITQAWRSVKSLRDEGAFGGWIFRIMHRVCAVEIKEQILRRDMSDIDDISIEFAENFKALELKEALSRLSDDEREIVLLSAVMGLSSKEIGAAVGARPSTVRSKLSRSLKKMREFLE